MKTTVARKLLLVVCMSWISGCGGVDKSLVFSSSPTHGSEVRVRNLSETTLRCYWKYKIKLDGSEKVRRLWRMDENLYALTSANRLVALDAAKGTYKWSYPIGGSRAQKVFAPCHADQVVVPRTTGIAELVTPNPKNRLGPFNAVIINTVSYALLINRDNGKLVRKLKFKFTANTPGSSNGTYFFVASAKGRYFAVRLSEGLTKWEMATEDMITARPQIFGNRLFVASQDGKLYVINPGKERDRHVWTQLTDAAISADFSVDGRGCFVPSQDYRLYAYDNLTGDEIWKFVTEGPLRDPVQVGIRTVFQYASGDRLYAIDIANKRKRWDLKNGRTILACAKIDKTPYAMVLTDRKQLLLVHEILGKVEKSFPMANMDLFVPNAVKPVIYAATADGKFVCIAPESVKQLTPEMLKD